MSRRPVPQAPIRIKVHRIVLLLLLLRRALQHSRNAHTAPAPSAFNTERDASFVGREKRLGEGVPPVDR